MSNLIFDISDNLCESIAKSRAVADLLRATNNRNLSDNTLPDIGWLLDCELKRMQEQVNRLMPTPGN
jgi:hypothetical protein